MPLLVSIRGRSGSAAIASATEIWSMGIWFRRTDGGIFNPTQEEMDDAATAAFTSYSAFHTAGGAHIQNNFFLTEVRTYSYQDDYQTQADEKPGQLFPARVVGYSTQTTTPAGPDQCIHPLQNTLVMSWEAEGRVKPKRGRIYLPTMNLPVGPDGLINIGNAQAIGELGKTLLTNLDAGIAVALGYDVEAVIQSRSGPAGSIVRNSPIRLIRMGRVMDTQRRRRNDLTEDYQDYPYP